jgi:hypothetical protein
VNKVLQSQKPVRVKSVVVTSSLSNRTSLTLKGIENNSAYVFITKNNLRACYESIVHKILLIFIFYLVEVLN